MRFYCFLLLAILPIAVSAQANYYDEPANAPITNTYVPIPSEMFMFMQRMASDPEIRKKMEQQKRLQEQQKMKEFERNVQLGIECLKKKQVAYFLSYANSALESGYYNSTLYYNMGIAYVLLKKKRIGKKWLKKALESGKIEAERALCAIKKKCSLSYEWFIY